MAKVHNLAFDYSAYDNAQEAEAQRAIKYKKNPALKQKTVSVVAVIGICLLVAVVLGTMATRFIPFMIFPEGKNPPEFVQYLGTVLPYAAIGLLIIYCLKDVPSSSTHGLPEAIAIIFIVLLHKWKKSTLLSIGGGTILYMILVQTVFH